MDRVHILLPGYSVFAGIAFFFITEAAAKTPRSESGLRFHTIVEDIKKGDIIAYEGTDGASANHLHLVCGKGHSNNWVKNSKGSWVIKGDSLPPEEVMYIDPKFTKIVDNKNLKFKEVPKEEPKEDKTEAFFPKKGYFSLGDNHKNIGKIAEFMYKTFPSYTNKKALGNYYGPYLQSSIKEFQKRAKAEKKYDAEIDGNVGPKTLKALKKYGFKE